MADEELRLELSAQVDKFSADIRKATEELAKLYHSGETADELFERMDKSLTRISGSMRDFSSSVKQAGNATQGVVTSTKDQEAALKKAHSAWDKQDRIYNDYLNHQEKATKATREANDEVTAFNTSIIAQRYALYDVATTYGAIGGALIGVSTLAVKTGADFERAFSDVERTVDFSTTQGQLSGIREELVELSTEIPKTFEELSQIATLGNQLGIASEDITAFTETVAQFSTIAGISVEETALAFGQLGNLLGVSADEYHRLGSAIALVGVNSAATEKQIVSIAREIAPAARAAGFTADAVIGLSGALGSIRVPPERSRSTMLQFFETLNMSVSRGGQELEDFARVVGVTSQELDRMVRMGEGEDILRKFIGNMSASDTVEITQALDRLGLAGLRTNPTIRALSDNVALMNQTFADGAAGFADGTEQARQFDIIADDLVSQFQILVNSINALVDTLTGGMVPGLAAAVGNMAEFINSVRDFAASDFGQQVSKVVLTLTVLVGVLAAVRAGAALASASTLALAYANAAVGSTGLLGNLRLMAAAMLGYTKVVDGAVVSTLTLRNALWALGRATLIFGAVAVATELIFNFGGSMEAIQPALIWVAEYFANSNAMAAQFIDAIADVAEAVLFLGDALGVVEGLRNLANGARYASKAAEKGAKGGIQDWVKSLNEAGKSTDSMSSSVEDLHQYLPALDSVAGGFDNIANSAGGAADAVKQVYTVADYASDLGSVMKRAFDIQFGSQTAMDDVTLKWIELNEQLRDYQQKVQELTADRKVTAYFLSIAEAYNDTLRAGTLRADLAKIDADLADATAGASKELQGNSKAAIQNRQIMNGLLQGYQAYIESLAASGADQAELNAAVARSEREFRAQALALGYSNEQIQPYIRSFREMKTVIDQIPRNITVGVAGLSAAQVAINEFMAQNTGGRGLSRGLNVPITASTDQLNKIGRGYDLIAQIQKLQADMASLIAAGDPWSLQGARLTGQAIQSLTAKLRSGNYRSGGYTGNGGVNEPAGIVHGQEFVFTAEATRKAGVGNLYSMMRAFEQGRGYRNGGYVAPRPVAVASPRVETVQLAAYDRKLLTDIRDNIGVTIQAGSLTRAVNQSNANASNRGAA